MDADAKNGPEWIEIQSTGARSATMAIKDLPGIPADPMKPAAEVSDSFAESLRKMIDERDPVLPSGVEEGNLRVSEVPGDRISFRFIWNGMPAGAVVMKRGEALEFLDGVLKGIEHCRLASAFA